MLKISIVDTPTERRLILVGRLIGPWILELQKIWEQSRFEIGTRKTICDLTDVIQIDESANALLLNMMKQGTELRAKGLLNDWLIQGLKEGKSHVSTRVVPNKIGIAHSVDLERREVRTLAEGTVTAAEVREHLLREQQDSALPYRELIDARHAGIAFSPAEIREIVDLLRSLSRDHRLGPTAIVVSSAIAYGVMRMLESLVEDVCVVRPFLDLAQAEAWLRSGSS